jgi:hypothetical protein
MSFNTRLAKIRISTEYCNTCKRRAPGKLLPIYEYLRLTLAGIQRVMKVHYHRFAELRMGSTVVEAPKEEDDYIMALDHVFTNTVTHLWRPIIQTSLLQCNRVEFETNHFLLHIPANFRRLNISPGLTALGLKSVQKPRARLDTGPFA